jgi:lambda repressor-like predicted transcriptional regulator
MCNQTILKQLNEKGWTAPKLAKELKIKSPSIVYRSIDGQGSRRMRVKIAKILDTPPSVIWQSQPKKQTLVDDLDFYS